MIGLAVGLCIALLVVLVRLARREQVPRARALGRPLWRRFWPRRATQRFSVHCPRCGEPTVNTLDWDMMQRDGVCVRCGWEQKKHEPPCCVHYTSCPKRRRLVRGADQRLLRTAARHAIGKR